MKTQTIKPHLFIKYSVVLLTAFFFNSMAYAEADKKIAEAKKTEPAKTTPETPVNPILSIIAADLNADKHNDAAVLIKSGDQADFYLYLGNAAGDMELMLSKKNLVWTGAMAGTLPQLKTVKGGVLLIHSENDAIGRNRWHQHLSVDYRDNDFIVTGYTHDERDTLDLKFSLNCDVNLLTGKGIKNNSHFKIDAQKIKLNDWSDEKIPKECRN